MTAFIFVYEPTNFRVDGAHPVKRFELQPAQRAPYASATTVIQPGTAADLARGIYGILSEDSEATEIHATDPSKAGVAYDLVTLKGKDRWPKFASEGQVKRVRDAFLLGEDEIDLFLGARKAGQSEKIE